MTQNPSPQIHVIAPGRPAATGGAAEVGNKAWNLMQMARIGLSVPPAFVLPTALCAAVNEGSAGEDGIGDLVARGVAELETLTRRGFGGARSPLLLSVRSGAAASMPGMMETVLNIGLNDVTLEAMIRATGNPGLAWDCYRRLIESYAEVVAGLPMTPFEDATARVLEQHRAAQAADLDFDGRRALARALLAIYHDVAGEPFPQDVRVQLARAVRAVFHSWNAEKAVTFRRLNGLDHLAGTAVTVQTMVFGNMGAGSGSGVGFTRDPSDGGDHLYLDFVFNAQGEDIVSGRKKIADANRLKRILPEIWAELNNVRDKLEHHFRDAQDFEFTVEDGRLWMLQTRRAKRTPWAALRIALDLHDQGMIDRAGALALLGGIDLAALERRRLADPESATKLGVATVASLGVATGQAAFSVTSARDLAERGVPVILIRRDTTTDDIEGMNLAAGILTAAGGRTSHAAVVARQLNKVCLVNCPALSIAADGRSAKFGDHLVAEKDWITLDGNDGAIYAGKARFVSERPDADLARIAGWRADVTATAESSPL